MRTSQKADRSRLIAAAMQQIPCDLTVENVKYVNMFTGEVYPASVDVLDGTVVRVREPGQATEKPSAQVYDGHGAYLLPGFIDTHMHVESTMMIPENLSRVIVPWGTTTVCTDPHEIGNVLGVPGVRFMLESAQKSALRQYVLAPSCVPAVPSMESAGASFGAAEVGELLDTPDVVGVAEIMDFVGVYTDDERMHSIIDAGMRRGAFLQGHAPYVSGKELAAYRLGGPISDHESNCAAEVQEKLRMGIHVNLRASSLVDSLSALTDGLEGMAWRDFVSVCTDDVHAKDLLTVGHINKVVGKIVAAGIPPLEAYKFATLNAAREYGFEDLGALAPGYLADMQLVDELDGRRPNAVFIRGRLVAENGAYLGGDTAGEQPRFHNSVNMPQITGPEDFLLKAPEGCGATVKLHVLTSQNDSRILNRIEVEELPVKDGYVCIEGRDDLQFVCVANRYGSGGKTVAVYKGFGLARGAMATTISHDSHNFTAFYRDPKDAWVAAQALSACGGGICVAADGKALYTLKLPVAGLMSNLPCAGLAVEIDAMQAAVDAVCSIPTSLLQAAVQALPCLPGAVVTDRGIVDGLSQSFIDCFIQ